jgi:pyruvate kinase
MNTGSPQPTEPAPPPQEIVLAALRAHVVSLQREIDTEAGRRRAQIDAVLAKHRASALNLAHYVGLRRGDLRRLQLDLAGIALSSLGRCEGHVADTLARIARWLGAPPADSAPVLDARLAEEILHANTRALFGARPRDRHVYVMVTAPEAAAVSTAWADAVLEAGANVLRINAAHESPVQWEAAIALIRRRAAALKREIRVFIDLAGPKLRGEIRRSEPGVLHLPRTKDRLGRTTAPTSVALVSRYAGGAQLPVPTGWLRGMRVGDVLSLTDAGGRRRALVVRECAGDHARAECDRSLYLRGGLALSWKRGSRVRARGRVGAYPRQPAALRLAPGDAFLLGVHRAARAGRLPILCCPEPEVLACVRAGERVILDDGSIVAIVESVSRGGLRCRVLQTTKTSARLRSGKGLTFPDSRIPSRGLDAEDGRALDFALAHADGVEVSFVNTAADVSVVGERLREAARPGFGMILKLETREAMRNLADILFQAMRYDPVGIMIARGDLAVELSFERLAEMQEELLWFGEACHLPVVWATQVLDSLAHSGVPTRAEVTDAAMSMRAECVMLNRGPHVAAAVRMLVDIIRKMEMHQYKKRSIYRPLSLALGGTAGNPDGSAGPAGGAAPARP